MEEVCVYRGFSQGIQGKGAKHLQEPNSKEGRGKLRR